MIFPSFGHRAPLGSGRVWPSPLLIGFDVAALASKRAGRDHPKFREIEKLFELARTGPHARFECALAHTHDIRRLWSSLLPVRGGSL